MDLDTLPAISFEQSAREDLLWIIPHLNSAFTEREGKGKSTSDAIAKLKLTIENIISDTVVSRGEDGTIFEIIHSSTGASFLLFVAKIRLDLPNHTFVADAFLLPVSAAVSERVGSAIHRISPYPQRYLVSGEEFAAWEALLPSLAERCRTWKHLPRCAYNGSGGLRLDGKLICGCGSGHDAVSFLRRGSWRPFAPYVTRVAISQLFPASYLEPTVSWVERLRKWRSYLVLFAVAVGASLYYFG